jgi:uncharacterized protein (UPF0548 family)
MADRRLPTSRRVRRKLARLRGASLNFDRAELVERPNRWNRDERLQPLAPEPPGPPQPDGSWEIARRLMRGYEFADPSMVRAHYDPDAPLEGRDMLLEVRFHGLSMYEGCRITKVSDRTERETGRPVRLWGWSYATLQGHFEQGEMSWEVLKWLDTGEVAFRVTARSRPSPDANPIQRLGFRLFGRREQLRFYDSSCDRVRRLTEAALRRGSTGSSIGRVARETTARRRPRDEAVHEELVRNVVRKDS